MLPNQAVFSTNRLLTSLPQGDREKLLALGESVELICSEILYCAGDRIPQVYFPTSGYISLLTPVRGDSGLEVGLIGTEGVLGITLTLGIDYAPFQAIVQREGTALRINSDLFLREVARSQCLQQLLKGYLFVTMRQLAQTAACNRFHVVEARLARWLLMSHDRAGTDILHATQLSLAYILGVRRVGITQAAQSLQQQKLIGYRRGDITILNRSGLEAVACTCYAIDKQTYLSTLVQP